jgi:acyl-CoA hydrolase/GNAT superfamily N-acetyltransferase
MQDPTVTLNQLKTLYPEKFAPAMEIFAHIHRGDRIFIGTGCGEPQCLVQGLIDYVEAHPKAIFDAEVFHVWTLGVAPYTDPKFKANFRHNSFFISTSTRGAVNEGLADYTPIFLSQVPALMYRGLAHVDAALIQTSAPDAHGYMSLGVSVDIVKAATEVADLVIAQINPRMPRVHGDTFIHIADVDYAIECDEPLLEYVPEANDETSQRIGDYVARLVEDGDTIQVGYGSIPNAIMGSLTGKKDLGVHTELVSDGIVDLMKAGVINNSRKSVNRGKTVAAFCMGRQDTYEYLEDNPAFDFRPIQYTNDPLVIAQHHNMTAINSALEIDLTGQATAESLGTQFYSGIGGQADFMRGAMLAPRGRSILAMPSTANDGEISRIVPFLKEGAAASLIRGDLHYVVTEYGIAYLHGENIRERAMALIAIAHPKFRGWLIQEAKRLNLIYKDQAFIPGKRGEYPRELETYRTTPMGLEVLLRPVRMTDEPLLKEFFYSLSDESLYRRFISVRKDMPHERLQEFVVIDYTKETMILATVSLEDGDRELVVGVGQYGIDDVTHTAEVAFVTRDDYQNQGIGSVVLNYLTVLAKKQGLLGFTAEVLAQNRPMLHVFEKMGFDTETRRGSNGAQTLELRMSFRGMP